MVKKGLLFITIICLMLSSKCATAQLSQGSNIQIKNSEVFSYPYDKVWKDVSNVERTAFESFLCLALLYVSRSEDQKGRLGFHAVFILILVYNLFFMIQSNLFHAGLLWLFKS